MGDICTIENGTLLLRKLVQICKNEKCIYYCPKGLLCRRVPKIDVCVYSGVRLSVSAKNILDTETCSYQMGKVQKDGPKKGLIRTIRINIFGQNLDLENKRFSADRAVTISGPPDGRSWNDLDGAGIVWTEFRLRSRRLERSLSGRSWDGSSTAEARRPAESRLAEPNLTRRIPFKRWKSGQIVPAEFGSLS